MSKSYRSIWAPPSFSWRYAPVYFRNFLVWKKLAMASLIGNIAEPLIWIIAFGYGLGQMVHSVTINGQGISYILFVSSGSICMSVMNAASFEALYSSFSRMQMQKTWDGILNAPIELTDVVNAEIAWSTTKSIISGVIIALVIVALGISHSPKIIVAVSILAIVGCCFSCIAMCITAVAKSFDFFTFYFTLVLTPMMFLSGVFFPINTMPHWVQAISELLPLTAAIDLVRPMFMDMWPTDWVQPIVVILVYMVVAYYLAIVLMKKRFAK